MSVASLFLSLLIDAITYAWLLFRPSDSLATENLFLHRQLALYQERKASRKLTDPATRFTMAVLSKRFDWRDALVIVKPRTLIRWHRLGFKLFWRYKSRPGRPPIPLELRRLIREMAMNNICWGEERIANELLLKLGIRVSPRTIRVGRPANYLAGPPLEPAVPYLGNGLKINPFTGLLVSIQRMTDPGLG